MPIEKLESPQNPKIKSTAKLRTNRGRRQAGKIIIDGEREISRAARAGVQLEAVFLPEQFSNQEIRNLDTRFYEVSRKAHRKIAFGERLEPVAVANRPDTTLQNLPVPSESCLFLALDAVEKPGNIGAVVRTVDGAGLDGVVLINPLADPFNPNAIRASLGTVFSTPIATCTLTEYLRWSSEHQVTTWLSIVDDSALDYREISFAPRTAIVVGSEAHGISDGWPAQANLGSDASGKLGEMGAAGEAVGDEVGHLFIPMRGIADSLNVSNAAAVLAYHVASQRKV